MENIYWILLALIAFGPFLLIFVIDLQEKLNKAKKYNDLYNQHQKLLKTIENAKEQSLSESKTSIKPSGADTVLFMRNVQLAQSNKNLKKQIETLSNKKGKIDKAEATIKDITEQLTDLKSQNLRLEKDNESLRQENTELKNQRCQDRLYNFINQCIEKTFSDFDSLKADLKNKKVPALKSAVKVAEAEKIAKEFEKKYLKMKYEYDSLFELFPELENYFETYEENNTESLEEVKDNYDYVRKYLSVEEYKKLSESERNQLALDRYIESRKKSKWQIGRDYELYIGYLYENKGYNISYTGIEKKLEDLGRDIIAENDEEILIIQCKYWSKEKLIREKHICQLYGTAIQYKKQTNTNKKIKPVFVTQTQLSDTAREFAQYLDVDVIENKSLEEFPRIKCNINRQGERIYHLPFDQQYDNTRINKASGESFEFTVIQAELKGFRRAKKWIGN